MVQRDRSTYIPLCILLTVAINVARYLNSGSSTGNKCRIYGGIERRRGGLRSMRMQDLRVGRRTYVLYRSRSACRRALVSVPSSLDPFAGVSLLSERMARR